MLSARASSTSPLASPVAGRILELSYLGFGNCGGGLGSPS